MSTFSYKASYYEDITSCNQNVVSIAASLEGKIWCLQFHRNMAKKSGFCQDGHRLRSMFDSLTSCVNIYMMHIVNYW